MFDIGFFRWNPLFEHVAITPDPDLFTDDWLKKRVPPLISSGVMHADYTPSFNMCPHKYNATYRSVCGPFFHIPEVRLPGVGPLEHRTAMARLIELRGASKPGFASRMRLNQTHILRRLRVSLHNFKKHLESQLIREHPDQSYKTWLNDPSPKKHLRAALDRAWRLDGMDGPKRAIGYKIKKYELLSAGKCRGIADLGEVRTQLTAYPFPSIKKAWTAPYIHGNYTSTFCASPDHGSLSAVFRALDMVDRGKVEFVYFSDDSCVSAGCSDGRVVFNADVKKCDNSHTTPMFKGLEKLLTESYGFDNLHAAPLRSAFQYLSEPVVMSNPHNRREKVKYQFSTHRLYSGSTLTTTMNNYANLCISLRLAQRVPDPSLITKTEFLRQYLLAGEDCGYELKTQVCVSLEDVQFLKHSCSLIDGEYICWVNLAVWFRGMGTISGDLPGRGSITARGSSFIRDVVVSREKWGNHAIRDSFAHYKSGSRVRMTGNAYREALRERSVGGTDVRIPLESLARRYSVSVETLEELVQLTRLSRLNTIVSHPVLSVLYNVDYG